MGQVKTNKVLCHHFREKLFRIKGETEIIVDNICILSARKFVCWCYRVSVDKWYLQTIGIFPGRKCF